MSTATVATAAATAACYVLRSLALLVCWLGGRSPAVVPARQLASKTVWLGAPVLHRTRIHPNIHPTALLFVLCIGGLIRVPELSAFGAEPGNVLGDRLC